MPEQPYYGGAILQLADQSPQAAAAAAQGDRGTLMGTSIATAGNIVQQAIPEFARIQDIGIRNKQDLDQRLAAAELQNEFISNQNKYFTPDGNIDAEKLGSLLGKYRNKVESAEYRYNLPESKTVSMLSRQNTIAGMQIALDVAASRLQVQKSRQSYDANIDYAIKSGDYDGAIARLESEGSTFYTPAEIQEKIYGIRTYGRTEQLGHEAMIDPVGTFTGLEMGEWDDLPLSTRDKAYASLSAAARSAVPRSAKKGKPVPEPPAGLSKGLIDLYMKREGDFSSPRAQQEAYDEFRSFARAQLTTYGYDDPEVAQKLQISAKAFGLDSGAVGATVDNLKKELSDPGSFKPDQIIRENAGSGMLATWQQQQELKAVLTGNKTDAEKTKAKQAFNEEQERVGAELIRKYDTWRIQNPKADYRECQGQMLLLIQNHRKSSMSGTNFNATGYDAEKDERLLPVNKAELMKGDAARAVRLKNLTSETTKAELMQRDIEQTDRAREMGKHPGMIELGNIDLTKRPVVRNADGSISTVRSASFNFDGKEYLLPTVSDDGRILADDEAVDLFKQTGRHLGVFDTPEHASTYAERLHREQAEMYLPKQPKTPPVIARMETDGAKLPRLTKDQAKRPILLVPEDQYAAIVKTTGEDIVAEVELPGSESGTLQVLPAPVELPTFTPGARFALRIPKTIPNQAKLTFKKATQ